MEFCDKIKFVRNKLKISQELLAHKIGVSYATINRLEGEKSFPSYNTLKNFESFCQQHDIIFMGQGNKND